MAQIQTENDPVLHPNHYNWIQDVECLDVAEHFNFNLGSAIKYIWRVPTKVPNEKIEDLRKAIVYLKREITRLRPYDEDKAVVNMSYFEGQNRKEVVANKVDYGPNTHRGSNKE